jgi:hypothetical protein
MRLERKLLFAGRLHAIIKGISELAGIHFLFRPHSAGSAFSLLHRGISGSCFEGAQFFTVDKWNSKG